MRSVRLSSALEAKIERAAALEGVSSSEVIRLSVARYCDERLSGTLRDRLADVIGVVSSGKIRGRDTGRQLTELLVRKHARRRARAR